jgi:hypothetical protein
VQLKTQKVILPFAIVSQTDMEPLMKDAERAVAFCLAELDRNKGGGFFKKKPPEKLLFVTEVYYPFWVFPFGDFVIVFDGLNVVSHSITYSALPDLKVFKDSMNALSETRQMYVTFLSNHLNYFQSSGSEETKVIDGLITDEDFLRDFMSYLKEATITETAVVDSVLVTPTNDEGAIQSIIHGVEKSRSKFVEEATELNGIIKLLNIKTQEFLTMLREEVKKTEVRFSKQIEKAKISLENETSRINKEYAEKVTEISTKFEQEIVAIQKEVIALEKTKEQIAAELEHCEAEIKTASINKDDVTVQKWKEKRSELKKEFPATLTKIKELEEKIAEIEESKKHVIFQLKSDVDAKIKEAAKDLIEAESSRDAETKICHGEMEKLEELTSNIIGQVDQLAKMRDVTIAEFDRLGIQQKGVNPTLVQMPFYLVCHQLGANKRYTFFAPSFVSGVSLGAKFRGAIGKGKISQLLQPRSKKIVSILNKFAVLLEENIVFSREINEACRKVNMLEATNLSESIKKGLEKLKEDGWLSEEEWASFSRIIT